MGRILYLMLECSPFMRCWRIAHPSFTNAIHSCLRCQLFNNLKRPFDSFDISFYEIILSSYCRYL